MGRTDTKRNPVLDAKLGEKRQADKQLVNGEREKIKEKKEMKIKKYIRPQEEEDEWMTALADQLSSNQKILKSLDIYPEIEKALRRREVRNQKRAFI